MKKYGIRVLVHMSSLEEVTASSKEEAIQIVNDRYDKGQIVSSDYVKNEYYDGYELDVEYEEESFGIRVLILFSSLEEVEAENEEDAFAQIEEMYSKGEIMSPDFADDEYYDGYELDVEYVEDLEEQSSY